VLFRSKGTPPKVAIIEYVHIAQAFFPEGRESKFVNAVLDHMAREARPEAF
jgi:N utilization substance protein B